LRANRTLLTPLASAPSGLLAPDPLDYPAAVASTTKPAKKAARKAAKKKAAPKAAPKAKKKAPPATKPSSMDFFEALRRRLVAQAEIFAALSSHTTITGSGRERALADLLREVLPRRLEVLSGVVARMDGGAPAKSTRQVDLIIADTHDFPVLARSGDLAVVLPGSVRAMVEIKTRVSGDSEMKEAITQLAESRAECTTGQTWYSALFSYSHPSDSKALREVLEALIKARDEAIVKLQDAGLDAAVRTKLQAEVSPLVEAHLPDLIVSERGAIAIKGKGLYQFYECDEGRAAVVLVSEILTAVTTDLVRAGSIGDPLATALAAAVAVHSKFLQPTKKQILAELPI
jgi:hypothetical protein